VAVAKRPTFLPRTTSRISVRMGFRSSLAGLAMAVPMVLAHGVHDHYPLGPIERRDLNHCHKEFSHETFVKRTLEIHGKELHRLRRNLGLEDEREEEK